MKVVSSRPLRQLQNSDLVFMCGGLGPTEDDSTKQTLAKFCRKELVFDPTALAKLDTFFASRLIANPDA